MSFSGWRRRSDQLRQPREGYSEVIVRLAQIEASRPVRGEADRARD
jgi:hypothetical protein